MPDDEKVRGFHMAMSRLLGEGAHLRGRVDDYLLRCHIYETVNFAHAHPDALVEGEPA